VRKCYNNANISFTPPNNIVQTQANVKWSKILINSVLVGKRLDCGPWTPEECHRALIAHNPSYAALKVTQKPSWVCPPHTLKENTCSSLVVAFKDPDGSVRCSLLSSKQLYLLGARAKVACWKEQPHKPHTTHSPNSRSKDKAIEELLEHAPTDNTPQSSTPADFSPYLPPVTRSMSARSKSGQHH
jgi:hypothetical protein